MTVQRAQWDDALADRPGPSRIINFRTIVERQDRTGSGAFRALTDEGRWWVKPLNNPQGGRVCVTDYVLARIGRLIDAPVCDVAVIHVSTEAAGEEYRPGILVPEGYAFGSRDLGHVHELRDLQHRNEDDNARRLAGVFAIFDWCWGDDDQWLYHDEADNSIYSHDHGHYLPQPPNWTADLLVAHVDLPRPQTRPATGITPSALEEYADRLDGVTFDRIRGILCEVPPAWPVAQHELETLGWFLQQRAGPVAARLRSLAGSSRGVSGA